MDDYRTKNDVVSKPPIVSVIVPAWNAATTIVRSISSALIQDVDLEIIIIDDASKDGTIATLHRVFGSDERVRVLKSNRNMGVSAARNLGISSALGRFIAFLDADDVWLPGKLKAQLELIETKDNVTLVTCNSLHTSPDGLVLKRGHRADRRPMDGTEAWKLLLERNFIPTPTVLVRKQDVISVGGFREDLQIGEDLDLWIRLAKEGAVAIAPRVYVHWFDYNHSLMKRSGSEQNAQVMDTVREHLDDTRLSDRDRRRITSRRNVELGDLSLTYGDTLRARELYDEAISNGHSSIPLAWKLVKWKLRNIFKATRINLGKRNK